MTKGPCTSPGCEKLSYCKTLCRGHYMQDIRTRHPQLLEKQRIWHKAYYASRKTWYTTRNALWRLENPEQFKRVAKTRKALWVSLNKERVRLTSRLHAKNNAGAYREKAARRRASQLQATPLWLTPEHLQQVKDIYEQAAELSWLSLGGLHVDHIIPLQGKTVRGLHVPWNLQILPAGANLRKSNNF